MSFVRYAQCDQLSHDAVPLYPITFSLESVVRSEYKWIKVTIKRLKTRKVQRQFSAYLSLALNLSAVPEFDAAVLRKIANSRAMKTVKHIRLRAQQLQQEYRSLQYNGPIEGLHENIEKLLSVLNRAPFTKLFRQQSALEKWAELTYISDRLHNEIKAIAPACVLERQQALRIYEKIQKVSK
ncbi:MAG: hypothetical protein KDH94_00390 [Coxiellaceae bacterium]|nr:hypothetical protein [Coxiellaceae bacterium]